MANIAPNPTNPFDPERLRSGWEGQIQSHRPRFRYLMTANFNQPTSEESLNRKLRWFIQRIDQRALGRQYLKKPNNRTFLYAFPEHLDTNAHAHMLVQTPTVEDARRGRAWPWLWFEEGCREIWEDVTNKKGQLHIAKIEHNDPLETLSSYVTKDFWRQDWTTTIIISTQFHPQTK